MKYKLIIGVLFILFFCEVKTVMAIQGFKEYVIKPGDTFYHICLREYNKFDFSTLRLIKKVNRLDEHHLLPGKIILLPIDVNLSNSYCPMPLRVEWLKESLRSVLIILSLEYFGAYENGVLVFWGPVCPGRKGHETPEGSFKAIYKTRKKISIKHKVPMPFAVQFHGDYFMHQQAMPGKPASSGCVRLLMDDAKKLYCWIKVDDPIIVKN